MSMIYINLLPWREERDAQVKTQFINMAVLSALVGAGFIGLWYALMFQQIEAQAADNRLLTQAIAVQDEKIAEIADLKEQIQVLVARKKVVENLQNNRNQATRIFEQLGTRVPEGVVIKSLKQVGPKITIVGVALNNTLVSKTMSAMDESEFFSHPVLVEIRATDAKSGGGNNIKASAFTMEIQYINPDEVEDKNSAPKKSKG